ncbi:MAG: DUF983 domain-containing protein [Bacteroidetes bacterium]|nr:DUF983 domain-containing protein [Bacteroidota bacterium]
MAFKDTILYSVVNNKCPRCHEGNFFETNNPYILNRFDKMHKNCPVCKEDFERETGFYYGAMYVSYGLTVAFGVGVFLLTSVILGYDAVTFLVTFGVLQIILMPVFYRMARLVWINFFVRYKEKETKKS